MLLDVTEIWTDNCTYKGVGFFKEAGEMIFHGKKHRKLGALAHWHIHGTKLGHAFSDHLGIPKPETFCPAPNMVGPPGDTLWSK